VKLLFDHNISPLLVKRLADLFPESAHVFTLRLHEATDAEVWLVARERGFALVSNASFVPTTTSSQRSRMTRNRGVLSLFAKASGKSA
jgi:predicted nuclease of predicted toxin-antitoxin system